MTPDRGPAEEDFCLRTHMDHFLAFDHLLNIHPDQLMLLIDQLHPQGPDLPAGTAYAYHIHRRGLCFHFLHPLSFVCSIIAHSFDYSKWNFLLPSPLASDIMAKRS